MKALILLTQKRNCQHTKCDFSESNMKGSGFAYSRIRTLRKQQVMALRLDNKRARAQFKRELVQELDDIN